MKDIRWFAERILVLCIFCGWILFGVGIGSLLGKELNSDISAYVMMLGALYIFGVLLIVTLMDEEKAEAGKEAI